MRKYRKALKQMKISMLNNKEYELLNNLHNIIEPYMTQSKNYQSYKNKDEIKDALQNDLKFKI
jgi:hypothetical protein